MKFGTVYWVTGLAGSGKTTIGKSFYGKLKDQKPNVIFLDGDTLRGVFGNNAGHSLDDRRELAMSYARLCKMISDQGIDVICATMSLFKEVHKFNRDNIAHYYEVFIECDMDELIRRDQKGIYSKAIKGDMKDVIGVNLPYDKPEDCDLVIDNTVQDRLNEKVGKITELIAKI
ncbi:MAG: adenylyl-sulfate kinase [Deltaproteobacteria bacterium]|nr:adenylyl-sulfate kinase [Deltaproteobacteria bacterium]